MPPFGANVIFQANNMEYFYIKDLFSVFYILVFRSWSERQAPGTFPALLTELSSACTGGFRYFNGYPAKPSFNFDCISADKNTVDNRKIQTYNLKATIILRILR